MKETPMAYVDGYVLPVKKEALERYWEMARLAQSVWKEHGALSYFESVGDDVPYGERTSFPRAVEAGEDEVVIFSAITYRDRAHRDEVNKKVMDDPRMKMDWDTMPFDGKRMIFGGFEVKLSG
jgi:uncharacterized protein YbaA (DUF1428 family)